MQKDLCHFYGKGLANNIQLFNKAGGFLHEMTTLLLSYSPLGIFILIPFF